jgi:hypothetical protein
MAMVVATVMIMRWDLEVIGEVFVLATIQQCVYGYEVLLTYKFCQHGRNHAPYILMSLNFSNDRKFQSLTAL